MNLRPSFNEIEQFTKPLCSAGLYKKKLDNFEKTDKAFSLRSEYCNGLPLQMHVEPSGYCNLTCRVCPRGVDLIERKGYLPLESFNKILNELSEPLTSIMISGFGEPLLNKHTTQMISSASKYSIATFMNTNGTILLQHVKEILDAGLSRINISLDGIITQSVHQYGDDTPFLNVIQAVETLCKSKNQGNYKSPLIIGQFIISDQTIDEMEYLKRWALDIGVEKVNFKRKHPTMPDAIEREKVFSKYNLKNMIDLEKVSTKEDLNWSQKDCSHPWDSFFLGCTGEISVCSFDPCMMNKYGDISKSFEEVWNNEKIKTIRRWHSGKAAITDRPCSRCNRLPGYLQLK